MPVNVRHESSNTIKSDVCPDFMRLGFHLTENTSYLDHKQTAYYILRNDGYLVLGLQKPYDKRVLLGNGEILDEGIFKYKCICMDLLIRIR